MLQTGLTERLGVELPIIQAPMAGSSTPELAACVIAGGGLGSLGCASMPTKALGASIDAVRQQASGPLNVNFFCHEPPEDIQERSTAMLEQLRPHYEDAGIAHPPEPLPPYEPFSKAQLEVLLDRRPEVVSFHFGLPGDEQIEALKEAGCFILSSATTVAEALYLEKHGVDAVIAQGYEAGGHRGMFLSLNDQEQAGLIALLPQIVDAVNVPVIAAGGIADGRGIAACLLMGASAVQMGTAFLRCPEASVNSEHRKRLAMARDDSTRTTRLYSGRPARGLVSPMMEMLADSEGQTAPFPAQISLLKPLRDAASTGVEGTWAPMWSGQSAALTRDLPAGELVALLASETRNCFARMQK